MKDFKYKDMPEFDVTGDVMDMARLMGRKGSHTVKCIDFTVREYDCLAVRTSACHWVGYVVIPKKHKFYKKDYQNVDVECHGGLTYGNHLHYEDSVNYNKWAVGFDFGHYDDKGGSEDEVREQCEKVVAQL